MTPTCAGLLESRGSGLGTAKIYIPCVKFHTQVVLAYLQLFLAQFTLEMRVAAHNCEKNSLKPAILRVKGHSRSSILTFLRRSSAVLVAISSMSVPPTSEAQPPISNYGEKAICEGVSNRIFPFPSFPPFSFPFPIPAKKHPPLMTLNDHYVLCLANHAVLFTLPRSTPNTLSV